MTRSMAAAVLCGTVMAALGLSEGRGQVPESPPSRSRGNIGRAVDPPPRSRTPPRPVPDTPEARLLPAQPADPRLRPPNPWRLGVEVDNLETGVEVTRVFPGTAASRAGLERGDIIVSVEGFQVGYVGRQLFDLGDELSRQVDSRGRANLLVWNRRNGQLANVAVTLERAGGGVVAPELPGRSTITGTATYRERIALPPGARLEVRLIQERHGRSPARTIASESVAVRNQVPVPFSISYDDRDIVRGGTYVIEAEITMAGRTLFSTPEPIRVLTGPGAERVELLLTSASR